MIEPVRTRVREENAVTMFAVGAALSVIGLVVAGNTGGGVDTVVGASVQLAGVGVLIATALWSDTWEPQADRQ